MKLTLISHGETDSNLFRRIQDDSVSLNDTGRKQATIFYKPVFYDRDAFLICCRFISLRIDFGLLKDGIAQVVVLFGDTEVFRSSQVHYDKHGGYKNQYVAENEALTEASNWRSEYFPDWENPAAYWN